MVLSARDIVKSYGSMHALKGVNFDIHRGKVTTLFGENGAGKSTLMKILAGVETPTSGYIELDGQRVAFSFIKRCARPRYLDHPSGVEPRRRTSACATTSSWAANCARATGVNFAEEARQARALMADLEEEIDPMTLVQDLRLGQQQVVEIARALSFNRASSSWMSRLPR